MKKVLLINANSEINPYPVAPIGLCMLQVQLEKNYNVKILDNYFSPDESVEQSVSDYQPDYIGISIRNIDNLDMMNPRYYIDKIYNEIIIPVRNKSRQPVILGGSGFSIFPREIFELFDADYGIIGEGEILFPYLLDCLDHQRTIKYERILIKGQHHSGLDPAPLYDFSAGTPTEIDCKIDFTPYKNRSSYPVQTKRGCAHHCIYCSYPLIEGCTFRSRAPVEIADEIEDTFNRCGVSSFEFVDSTFNDPPDHAEAICREIIKRKLNLKLRTMGINPERVSSELFDLMKTAGFFQIDCTPDTASEKLLISYQKNFNRRQLIQTSKIINAVQLPTMWFFIFGGPQEDERSCLETLDFIDRYVNKADMAHATLGMRLYPHTRLYKTSLEEGRLKPQESLLKPYFYFTPNITEERLIRILSDFSKTHPNFVTLNESTPSPEMMKEAMHLKQELKLDEPMFRTLLRVRYAELGIPFTQITV